MQGIAKQIKCQCDQTPFYAQCDNEPFFNSFFLFLLFCSFLCLSFSILLILILSFFPNLLFFDFIASFFHLMECYTTPWPLWRESRNLWHFIELSFAFGVPLSLFLPYCSLFFVFTRVIARLQARGTRAAISAFTQVKTKKREQ